MINEELLNEHQLKESEINSIIESMNEDAKLSSDLAYEALRTGEVIEKWLSTESNLKQRLFVLDRALGQLFDHLTQYYRGKLPIAYYKEKPLPSNMNLNHLKSVARSDREIKGLIEADPRYITLMVVVEEMRHYYELVKKYGERVAQTRSYHINNAINAEKIKLGMF